MICYSLIAHAVIPHEQYIKLTKQERIEIAKNYYYKFTKSNLKNEQ